MSDMGSGLQLLEGGRHVDARGTVSFVNDFHFEGVERFYAIRAQKTREPRGWVGHRRERKWFTVLQGEVLLAVVRPDSWETPSADLPVERYTLSGDQPQVLCVPGGHATGSAHLSKGAVLIVFSSGSIEDAGADDYRFPLELWEILPPGSE